MGKFSYMPGFSARFGSPPGVVSARILFSFISEENSGNTFVIIIILRHPNLRCSNVKVSYQWHTCKVDISTFIPIEQHLRTCFYSP